MKNQILAIDNSSKKNKNSSKIEIEKIIKVFAIIMIMFSIGFISMGTYAIVENNALGTAKPEVKIEKQNSELLITATSDKGINKVIYVWNDDGNEETIEGNAQTVVEQKIKLPTGNNTLKVTVYDTKGKTAIYEKNYEVESKEPQLSIEASNGKIKITAKDNEQMAYITYRWDDEEETKIEATQEALAQIEQEIEIPRGQHKLTVVAVNTQNLTTTKEQEVKGVTKPTISVVQDAEQPKYLILSVSDEEAIQKVQFSLNGKEYLIDLSNYKEKHIQYKPEMIEGENTLIVTATNFDGAEATFEGTCTYTP